MLRSQQRSLNTDRFLYAAVSKSDDTSDPSAHPMSQSSISVPIDSNNGSTTSGQYDPKTPSPEDNTCCGIESCYFGVQWTPKNKYLAINYTAVFIHFICAVAIFLLNESRFHRIPEDYAFVAPLVKLQWTNYALVMTDATVNTCSEVSDSPHFKATIPSSSAIAFSPFPPRTTYPNFLDPLFDFTNTTLIQYNHPGSELYINWMMMCFFILSCLFQLAHGLILQFFDENFPRVLHYIEYSFSSPLMIMVMAVNVGIKEMFLITSLAGLFFGMNILGMCAEAMMHYAGRIDKEVRFSYVKICILIHLAGWFLFLFAMIPVWKQFDQVLKCSERMGTPTYAYAAIVLESICFFLFGFIQSVGLLEKYWHFDAYPEEKQIPTNILFKYDSMHALLSLTAKVFLAWLLLGPALSVKEEFLKPC
jgi:hypothetical protein